MRFGGTTCHPVNPPPEACFGTGGGGGIFGFVYQKWLKNGLPVTKFYCLRQGTSKRGELREGNLRSEVVP